MVVPDLDYPGFSGIENQRRGDVISSEGILLFRNGRIRQALLKWMLAVNLGSVSALRNLGYFFMDLNNKARGKPRDYEKAAIFFKAAMLRGCMQSMSLLGQMHVKGLLKDAEPEHGLQLMAQAARAGYCEWGYFEGVMGG